MTTRTVAYCYQLLLFRLYPAIVHSFSITLEEPSAHVRLRQAPSSHAQFGPYVSGSRQRNAHQAMLKVMAVRLTNGILIRSAIPSSYIRMHGLPW